MEDVKSRIVDLDLNDVLPNRFQPRIKFSEDSIIELSESIKEHGVIQPIVVRPIGDKYEIIAGERRYKASVLAGKETIPAIITDLNDKDSAEVALIENVQRKDLTAIEEAISYKKILDMGYLTQEQLAIKLGRSQSTVANKIRLLNLCDEVQEALMEDKISERHARSMLKLQNAEQQRIMLNRIIKERLTVRKTDEEIDKMNTYITNEIEPQDQPTNNPGFMDVDKIANNAQDLQFEDKAGNVNINALLQGNSPSPMSSPAPSGVAPTSNAQGMNMFNQPMISSAPVDLMAPATPTPVAPPMEQIPLTPAMEAAPAIPTVPVEPVVPQVPLVEPVTPTIPVVPTVPSVEPVEPVAEPAVPEVAPVAPVTPVVEPAVPQVPLVEPVTPVEPVVSETPVTPVIPVVTPTEVTPVAPTPSVFESAPKVTPIAGIAPMPSTPIVDSALPSQFSEKVEEPVSVEPVLPEINVAEADQNLKEAEEKLNTQSAEVTPIIITDYSKQYDPVLPKTEAAPVQKVDFKQIINLIRDVNATIEKCGYTIETEEYDLEGMYQVVFKINKD